MTTLDLNGPLANPPPGVTANFASPPNHATLAYSILIISTVLVTFFTWFRSIVKAWVVRAWYLEDYLVPLAWLAAISNITCAFMIYSSAPIIHSWDMTWRTFTDLVFYSRISTISYNIAILIIKLAMLIQVLRIFIPLGSKSITYYVIHFLIWVNSLFYVTAIFLMIFACTPIKKSWKPWLEGKCINTGAIAMTTSIVNLGSDLAILAVTQKVIWNLIKIDEKKRLQLSAVFCAGILPCALAVLCLIYNARMLYSKDFAYDAAIMALACHGEITSGLFVLFLPVLPRFFTLVRKKSHMSSYFYRGPGRPKFSDIGVAEEGPGKGDKEKNVWRTSHSQVSTGVGTMSTVWEEESRGEDTLLGKSAEPKGGRSWLSTPSLDEERGFVYPPQT